MQSYSKYDLNLPIRNTIIELATDSNQNTLKEQHQDNYL